MNDYLINYFKKQSKENPGKLQALELQLRLRELGKTQNYLARLFNRTKAQISMAINTEKYPRLRKKIIRHIQILENRKNS